MFAPSLSELGIILLGFCIGLLSGLLGVGGGFLVTPMLNILFGIPYNIAVGSGLTQMVGTSLSGVVAHRRRDHVDLPIGATLVVGASFGTVVGTFLINSWRNLGVVVVWGRTIELLTVNMSVLYFLLLVSVGSAMGRDVFLRHHPRRSIPKRSWFVRVRQVSFPPLLRIKGTGHRTVSAWLVLVAGVILGVLAGLMGVGGGFVALPFMLYGLGMSTNIAVGTSLFQVLFASLFGSITHVLSGNVDWMLVGLMLAGSIMGSQLGVRMADRVRELTLRRFFVVLVFGAAAMVFLKLVDLLRPL